MSTRTIDVCWLVGDGGNLTHKVVEICGDSIQQAHGIFGCDVTFVSGGLCGLGSDRRTGDRCLRIEPFHLLRQRLRRGGVGCLKDDTVQAVRLDTAFPSGSKAHSNYITI
ncbi:hypothetical protein SAMN04487904_102354 [Actinopolyspora lacussalsi subsp. righensis]|uniref:Uncharacterized protein n=1 Tax=Actinopolyspora righensis TaxID=995060 RepID=A0A1I6YAD6_9ACTN|nr:hypothetical protein SAMN04487904_102354 [Actinopolyspora righensis]